MVLENEFIRVELDPATGGFRSLVDKRIGREYVGAPDRALLFRLMVPDGDRQCECVESADATVSVTGSTATVERTSGDIAATATIELRDDTVIAELSVVNNGVRPVEELMFPLVRGVARVPDAEFVWPHFHFRRIADPFATSALGGDHHSWNEGGQKHTGRYPAWLTNAWMQYGDAKGGIALEGRQDDHSIMDFFLHKIVEKDRDPVRRTLDLMTVHPRRVLPGETYSTPPVHIRLHAGDWHTVADSHREWLETWVKRADTPGKFRDAIGWHFFFMKHQDGHVVNRYADLPKMAGAALAAGCRYLLVFGWQTGGHDNNYLYRYVPNEKWGGEDALRDALAECRKMGVEVMPFFNGTLANIGLPEHREFGWKWEAKTRTGHPYYAGDWARHNVDAPTRNRAMLHHEVCPCDDFRPYFVETVRRIVAQYGFGNTQLDQFAEKMFLCYNPDHDHGRPDTAYPEGLAALYPEIRRIVREANPEGVMISEGLNNFSAGWCDSSWDWHAIRDYPDPILYTMPWALGSLEVDALEYGDVNRAFAYKLHLDMKIDGGDAPITKYPTFAAFVKERAELRARVRPYYVDADFRDQEGIESVSPGTSMVKVFHNRKQRKVGIVLAELEGRATDLHLEVAWKAASRHVVIESARGGSEEASLTDRYSTRLEPFELRVLCIDV